MARALGDITNGSPSVGPGGMEKASGEKSIEVQQRGDWVPKIKYDYTVYNADTQEAREAAAGASGVPAWAANAEKYEWSEEFGDVGPAHPELEKQLFGNEHLVRSGSQFERIKEINVLQEGLVRINPVRYFEDAGLHPIMMRNIELCRYDVPTPIQAYCLPAILKGYDIIACAQTGSGKTAAFLVPTLSKLMGKAKRLAAPRPNAARFNPETDAVRAEPLLLVVAPTRELVTQIFDEARRFCYRSMLRPCVIYGGAPIHDQRLELQKGCDVLVATPGRLRDFMSKTHLLSLHRLKYTIIDEADEMLNVDWSDDLKAIMSGAKGVANSDGDRTYMMFSATFPKEARELAREFMAKDHVRIRVGRAGSTTQNVQQKIVYALDHLKKQALYDLIASLPPVRTIIFVNSKRTADFLDDYMFNMDFPSTSIHADRTQREREDALNAFRKGKTPILIATGVSARGLDIGEVMHIVNYDLPSVEHGGIDEYIHRIGRTARIGNTGEATSFYNERNEDIAEALVKILLESKQEVPEFLQQYVPEGGHEGVPKLVWDDESDLEEAVDNVEQGEVVEEVVPVEEVEPAAVGASKEPEAQW
ncbi:MAG: hypothetical protein M1832_003337 [Thelocarpon impressellum]|nr:MAG: hypothetical protein M1832_003337 [Thelocarpon impressellum]